jgi:hypothetical protein
MRYILIAAAVCAALATPANAESELQKGFEGALRGCEEWVLNPGSWSHGVDPFVRSVGLGRQMGAVTSVEEVNLPPQQLRGANRYWRINSTLTAGYVLVVSDELPMCHITGGGDTDLQPTVEAVLASASFKSRWEQTDAGSRDDLASTEYRHREDPRMSIIVSRARQPGRRLDRVQVMATALYRTED